MNALFDWIRGIAAFLVLTGIFLQLVPEGSYRKYLRFFAGLILMILICRPLLQAGKLEEWFLRQVDQAALEQNRAELEADLLRAEGDRQERLESKYQELIREQVVDIAGPKGYQVLECRALLQLDAEAGDFGQVKKLEVCLLPAAAAAEILVEPIKIGGESPETGEHEVTEIRQELLQLYGLEEDGLTLQVRE